MENSIHIDKASWSCNHQVKIHIKTYKDLYIHFVKNVINNKFAPFKY